MKPKRLLKSLLVGAFAVAMLASCSTKKSVVRTTPVAQTLGQQEFMNKVSGNANTAKFITSKIKFEVKVGPQELTLTGNLKMKRDDVIRLQLMAFGFVEAGRLEFTPDYVLIMDRINKQYIHARYEELEFLRNSGLNFYSLQALFWNELFQPGESKITAENFGLYTTNNTDAGINITLKKDKMTYSWLADSKDATLQNASILYSDKYRGNTSLTWDYSEFQPFNEVKFPTKHAILFKTQKKDVELGMTLNYLKNESEWETRTEISSKYKRVTVDEILRRFMAL